MRTRACERDRKNGGVEHENKRLSEFGLKRSRIYPAPRASYCTPMQYKKVSGLRCCHRHTSILPILCVPSNIRRYLQQRRDEMRLQLIGAGKTGNKAVYRTTVRGPSNMSEEEKGMVSHILTSSSSTTSFAYTCFNTDRTFPSVLKFAKNLGPQ